MARIQIIDGFAWLDGKQVPYEPAKHIGGRIEPTLLIGHDTAGHLKKFQDKNYLRDDPEGRKVSVHFVLERDGTLTQLVPCDRRANHCEPSSWNGVKGCNGRSIGVETVNPGGLVGDTTKAVAWFGKVFTAADGLVAASSPGHTHKVWLAYTPEQLEMWEELARAIAAAYPIEALLGHFQISPGRKEDVGPHFPLDRIRAAMALRPRLPPKHDIAEAQGQLNGLGYFVGKADGIVGPRTRGAIRTFQEQNGLAMSGSFDDATMARLFAEDAKEMPTGSRDQITAADLRMQGSVTASSTNKTRYTLMAVKAGLLGDAIAEASKDVQTVQTGLNLVDTFDAVLARAIKLVDYVQTPRGAMTAVVLAALGSIWWWNNRIEKARVADASAGANAKG